MAIVIAGLVITLVAVGATFAAAQSGILSASTTTIQINGDISMLMAAQKPTDVEPTAIATVQTLVSPDTEIVSRTEVIPIQYITRTVVIVKRDTSVEDLLTSKLDQAYQQLRDREAAYQVKLQDAYNRLTAAQNVASQVAIMQLALQPTPQPTSPPTQQPESRPPPKPASQPPPQPTSPPSQQPESRPPPKPTSQPTPQPTSQPTPEPTPTPQHHDDEDKGHMGTKDHPPKNNHKKP